MTTMLGRVYTANPVGSDDQWAQPFQEATPTTVPSDPQFTATDFAQDLFRAAKSDRATGGIEDAEELADLMRAREERARGEVRWLAEGESVSDAHTE